MSNAHRRPKTPEQTRRALLDAAAAQAMAQGMAVLSLPVVAEAAGLTKGAVFHHFGARQGLIDALCADLIARIDADIDATLAEDDGGFGSFTRAYVTCTFTPRGHGSPWTCLSLAAVTDPGLARIWADWMQGRLARHAATDQFPELEIVRLATDGYWLAALQNMTHAESPRLLCRRLLAMTHKTAAALPA